MDCKLSGYRDWKQKVRNFLCIGIAVMMLLTGCDLTVQMQPQHSEPGMEQPYCTYELNFSVACAPEDAMGEWEIVYTYFGEEIEDKHRIQFPEGVFSFHPIQVDVAERAHPRNSFSGKMRVAVINGGSGRTELTVKSKDGRTAVFYISCNVSQVAVQYTDTHGSL